MFKEDAECSENVAFFSNVQLNVCAYVVHTTSENSSLMINVVLLLLYMSKAGFLRIRMYV